MPPLKGLPKRLRKEAQAIAALLRRSAEKAQATILSPLAWTSSGRKKLIAGELYSTINFCAHAVKQKKYPADKFGAKDERDLSIQKHQPVSHRYLDTCSEKSACDVPISIGNSPVRTISSHPLPVGFPTASDLPDIVGLEFSKPLSTGETGGTAQFCIEGPLLGEGTFGLVVRGRQLSGEGPGRPVAMKFLKDGTDHDIDKEVEILQQVHNISGMVKIIGHTLVDLRQDSSRLLTDCIITELAPGMALSELLEEWFEDRLQVESVIKQSPPSSLTAARAAKQMKAHHATRLAAAKAVASQLLDISIALDARGLCNVDFKPANHVVARTGSDWLLTEVDVGAVAAKDAEGRISADAASSGTIFYFAPEVLRRHLSPTDRTKVKASPLASWAVGIAAYEALTLKAFHFKQPPHLLEMKTDDLTDAMMCDVNAWDECGSHTERLEMMQECLEEFVPSSALHSAAHFLTGLLHTDPALRTTLDQARQHPFLA